MVLLVAVLSTVGCEEEVTAVLGTERAYSLYGVLTPEADTQWVRVYEIENRLQPIEDEPIQATLTSEDVSTGRARTWQDTVITEPDGRHAHAFFSTFRAEYGHTYRVTVEGADQNEGSRSLVTAEVPDSAYIEIDEPRSLGAVSQPVFVRGDVPRLSKLRVIYYVKFDRGEISQTTREITVPYDGRQQRIEGGWRILISLSRDYDTVRQQLSEQGVYQQDYGVRLLEIRLRFLAVNEPWNPPGGVFDSELLVQPGTMSNVEDGFGFVGAGYELSTDYLPDDEFLEEAGFTAL